MNGTKICFGMIVFNSDFVLEQVLESIYPFAEQIVITHGTVKFWQDQGFKTSTDDTAKILDQFPDPGKKITVINACADEKTGLCQAYMPHIHDDITHLWTLDADEVFKPAHIERTIEVLRAQDPHSISFTSNTFFGGFHHILTGFEREHNFKRVLKYKPGCTFIDHRPPTLSVEQVPNPIHITGKRMLDAYGVEMYHYSYVFARQVYEKLLYYEDAVISPGKCIKDYFRKVWLAWVLGDEEKRQRIETEYKGVHEFVPEYRGACYTQKFIGQHPEIIKRDIEDLFLKFSNQILKAH